MKVSRGVTPGVAAALETVSVKASRGVAEAAPEGDSVKANLGVAPGVAAAPEGASVEASRRVAEAAPEGASVKAGRGVAPGVAAALESGLKRRAVAWQKLRRRALR
jgi:hypothetical protein